MLALWGLRACRYLSSCFLVDSCESSPVAYKLQELQELQVRSLTAVGAELAAEHGDVLIFMDINRIGPNFGTSGTVVCYPVPRLA